MKHYKTRKQRRAEAAAGPRLSDDLRRWIAENLMLGAGEAAILARLVERGTPRETAEAEIAAAKASPYFLGVARAASRARKRDWMLGAYGRLAEMRDPEPRIDRLERPSGDVFFRDYYAGHRPLLITGAIDDWPAMELWSLDYFEARLGDPQVEVQLGREARPDYEIRSNELARKMAFSELLARLRTDEPSNDYYCTANNGSHNREALAPLWDDIGSMPEYLEERTPKAGFFWLGPRGAVTPFHHDLTNNFLVQIKGRKRVKLAASYDTPKMRNHIHCYSQWTGQDFPEGAAPDPAKPRIYDYELQPGEILFIPVGWWHHVESLDMTIGMSFTNFRWPNDFNKGYTTYQAV